MKKSTICDNCETRPRMQYLKSFCTVRGELAMILILLSIWHHDKSLIIWELLFIKHILLAVGEDKMQKNQDDAIENMVQPVKKEKKILISSTRFWQSCITVLKILYLGSLQWNDEKMKSTFIRHFPGKMKWYCSFSDDSEGTNTSHFPTAFLDLVNLFELTLHKLELKVGFLIRLMRNLALPKFCNGTMIIKELHKDLTVAEINIGAFKDEILWLQEWHWFYQKVKTSFLSESNFQYSCALLSVHKGQIMDNVLIFLQKPILQHGQVYVAFGQEKRNEH